MAKKVIPASKKSAPAKVSKTTTVATKKPTKTDKVLAGMNEATRALYDKICGLWCDDARKSVMARYEIGVQVAQAVDKPQKYGGECVKQLAEALSVSTTELYDTAIIAATYTKDELKTLLNRLTPRGNNLTYSHIRNLAKLPDKLRKQMEDAAINQCLTVADLLNQIAAKTNQARGKSGPLPPKSPLSAINKLIKTSRAQVAMSEVYEQALFDRLESMTSEQVTDAMLAALEEATSEQAALEQFARNNLQRLNLARTRFESFASEEDEESADAEPDDEDVVDEEEEEEEEVDEEETEVEATGDDDDDDEDLDDDLDDDLEDELDEADELDDDIESIEPKRVARK